MPLLSMPAKNVFRVNMKCGPALVRHWDNDVCAPPDNLLVYFVYIITHNDAVPAAFAEPPP